MLVRTQEKYRKVSRTILRLKNDTGIFLSTLFNTGGMDLPGARDVRYFLFFAAIDIETEISLEIETKYVAGSNAFDPRRFYKK